MVNETTVRAIQALYLAWRVPLSKERFRHQLVRLLCRHYWAKGLQFRIDLLRRMKLVMEHTSMGPAVEVRVLEEMPPELLTVIEGAGRRNVVFRLAEAIGCVSTILQAHLDLQEMNQQLDSLLEGCHLPDLEAAVDILAGDLKFHNLVD